MRGLGLLTWKLLLSPLLTISLTPSMGAGNTSRENTEKPAGSETAVGTRRLARHTGEADRAPSMKLSFSNSPLHFRWHSSKGPGLGSLPSLALGSAGGLRGETWGMVKPGGTDTRPGPAAGEPAAGLGEPAANTLPILYWDGTERERERGEVGLLTALHCRITHRETLPALYSFCELHNNQNKTHCGLQCFTTRMGLKIKVDCS